MALWPLFLFDDDVHCFSCDKLIGKAKDGQVIGFGDGNGNRELVCSCGYKTFFDATKSAGKASEHAQEHGPALVRMKTRIKEWIASKRAPSAQKKTAARTPAPSPTAAPSGNVFLDYGSLINTELQDRKVRRGS